MGVLQSITFHWTDDWLSMVLYTSLTWRYSSWVQITAWRCLSSCYLRSDLMICISFVPNTSPEEFWGALILHSNGSILKLNGINILIFSYLIINMQIWVVAYKLYGIKSNLLLLNYSQIQWVRTRTSWSTLVYRRAPQQVFLNLPLDTINCPYKTLLYVTCLPPCQFSLPEIHHFTVQFTLVRIVQTFDLILRRWSFERRHMFKHISRDASWTISWLRRRAWKIVTVGSLKVELLHILPLLGAFQLRVSIYIAISIPNNCNIVCFRG